jgi:DNA-binding MarR family transcriptional regulator
MKRTGEGGAAGEAWLLLFELLVAARPHVPAAAAACALTEPQCHLLRLLEPGRATSMRCLAEALGCDASNITGIVDRLEARGLVERRACTRDRRVKELALTPAGAALRARVLQRLSEPPAPIARLSSEDQRALCAILRKALGKT